MKVFEYIIVKIKDGDISSVDSSCELVVAKDKETARIKAAAKSNYMEGEYGVDWEVLVRPFV